jgi:hypothetical protein
MEQHTPLEIAASRSSVAAASRRERSAALFAHLQNTNSDELRRGDRPRFKLFIGDRLQRVCARAVALRFGVSVSLVYELMALLRGGTLALNLSGQVRHLDLAGHMQQRRDHNTHALDRAVLELSECGGGAVDAEGRTLYHMPASVTRKQLFAHAAKLLRDAEKTRRDELGANRWTRERLYLDYRPLGRTAMAAMLPERFPRLHWRPHSQQTICNECAIIAACRQRVPAAGTNTAATLGTVSLRHDQVIMANREHDARVLDYARRWPLRLMAVFGDQCSPGALPHFAVEPKQAQQAVRLPIEIVAFALEADAADHPAVVAAKRSCVAIYLYVPPTVATYTAPPVLHTTAHGGAPQPPCKLAKGDFIFSALLDFMAGFALSWPQGAAPPDVYCRYDRARGEVLNRFAPMFASRLNALGLCGGA